MTFAPLIPLALQALAMAADEGYFHRSRGLTRWERIGHPLDTLTVLACYAVTLAPVSRASSNSFLALAVFSCLFVTKDESVHHRFCGAKEQWLHSVLFLLHPIVLGCVYILWTQGAHGILELQMAMTFALGAYQTLYWNTTWLRPRQIR